MAIATESYKYLGIYSDTTSKFSDQFKFKIDAEFMKEFIGKQPNWSIISYITYKRTYSRWIKEENRTEEYWETIERVVEGCFKNHKKHCLKFNINWNEQEAQELAQKMFLKMWNFKFIPAGRGLWIMGTEFEEKYGSMALCNCGFVSTEDIDIDPIKIFEWIMDALMLGVGVGFDTLGGNKITIKSPKPNQSVFTIPDSRKGWIDGMKLLLKAFFFGDEEPEFNYSLVRKKGERINGFGGISSGHEPLRDAFESIRKLLKSRIGMKLSSIDILDIVGFTAKCIVSGNIRRSACICLGDKDDSDFIHAKEDEVIRNDRRWTTNNSINGKVGMNYKEITEMMRKNGEPAVIWLDNARKFSRMGFPADNKDYRIKGINPCAEMSLESMEMCNLVETFPSRHESYEEWEDTLFFAYFYAKTVTLIPTHWKETNEVIERNRRMGISQSGIIDAFVKHGRRNMLLWSTKGYNYLEELDNKVSAILNIPTSIKLATVKPSGTVSILAGVSSGIHYPQSEFYIHRIRFSENHELIPILRDCGYHIEQDINSPNTLVVDFLIHEKNFNKSRFDVSAWEQVINAVDYQHYWADNQISITVTFKKSEEKDLESILEFAEDKLKGLSFLPLEEHGYKQAPLETITKEQYYEMKKNIKPIPFIDTVEEGEGENYCSGGFCQVKY